VSADAQDVLAVADLLEHGLPRVERVAALVDVRELHGVARADRAAVGLELAGEHPEQSRLARAVRPDHADDPTGRQRERTFRERPCVGGRLPALVRLDPGVAEPRARRFVVLVRLVAGLDLLGRELLEAREPRLRLRAPRARIRAPPLELDLDRALARCL